MNVDVAEMIVSHICFCGSFWQACYCFRRSSLQVSDQSALKGNVSDPENVPETKIRQSTACM